MGLIGKAIGAGLGAGIGSIWDKHEAGSRIGSEIGSWLPFSHGGIPRGPPMPNYKRGGVAGERIHQAFLPQEPKHRAYRRGGRVKRK